MIQVNHTPQSVDKVVAGALAPATLFCFGELF